MCLELVQMALMGLPFDLPNWAEVIHVPDFDHASLVRTQQHGAARDEGQGTDPIFVCSWDLL